MFASFTQATEEHTRHHGGLGLGLAICSHLAQLMGASLSVHNNTAGPGATAQLQVSLPLQSAPSSDDSATSKAAGSDSCAVALHISDSALRRQLQSSLDALGVRHFAADSLQHAACEQQAFFCSIGSEQALVMLCMRGDAAATLQQGWKGRPVVVVCADEPVAHALRVFSVSLMMPVRHSQLAAVLRSSATGGTGLSSSLHVPLGAPQPQAQGVAPIACTAGFGGTACGYCSKCQAAVHEGFDRVVRTNPL